MCQVGASGTAKPPRALAPPLLWGLKSPGRRGNGMEQVPRWPSPPPAPQVTLALCPRCAHSCCPMAAPAAWGAAPAPPKGQALLSASKQLINYLSLGAFSSLGSPGTARCAGVSHPSLVTQAVGQEGTGCSSVTSQLTEVLPSSSTTGKPNAWDILVVCCEIVF